MKGSTTAFIPGNHMTKGRGGAFRSSSTSASCRGFGGRLSSTLRQAAEQSVDSDFAREQLAARGYHITNITNNTHTSQQEDAQLYTNTTLYTLTTHTYTTHTVTVRHNTYEHDLQHIKYPNTNTVLGGPKACLGTIAQGLWDVWVWGPSPAFFPGASSQNHNQDHRHPLC